MSVRFPHSDWTPERYKSVGGDRQQHLLVDGEEWPPTVSKPSANRNGPIYSRIDKTNYTRNEGASNNIDKSSATMINGIDPDLIGGGGGGDSYGIEQQQQQQQRIMPVSQLQHKRATIEPVAAHHQSSSADKHRQRNTNGTTGSNQQPPPVPPKPQHQQAVNIAASLSDGNNQFESPHRPLTLLPPGVKRAHTPDRSHDGISSPADDQQQHLASRSADIDVELVGKDR